MKGAVTIYTLEGEMHQQLITEEVMLLDGARLTTFVVNGRQLATGLPFIMHQEDYGVVNSFENYSTRPIYTPHAPKLVQLFSNNGKVVKSISYIHSSPLSYLWMFADEEKRVWLTNMPFMMNPFLDGEYSDAVVQEPVYQTIQSAG